MHEITELPAWERLFKRIVWKQIGEIEGKRILDFGSGQGITANYFAKKNEVIAIEPSEEMLMDTWRDYWYTQIAGDIKDLSAFVDGFFDIIICHNVLEYIDDKASVIKALTRVLKQDGILSIVKHNRPGRVMQMAVLLDDFEKANALLDGKNSAASKFGSIRYYEDNDILKWEPALYILSFYEASGHELDGEKLLEIKRQAVDKLKFLGKFVDGNKSKWPYRLFEKTYVKFNRMQKEYQEKGEWMDKSPVLEQYRDLEQI